MTYFVAFKGFLLHVRSMLFITNLPIFDQIKLISITNPLQCFASMPALDFTQKDGYRYTTFTNTTRGKIKMKNIYILILILSLAGCAAVTPTMLRESATAKGNVLSVTVDENYQSVYRMIVEKARMDFPPGAILGGGFKVDSDLYGELGLGEINVTFIPISKNILLIDIKDRNDRTDVTIFWNRWKLDADRIRDHLLRHPAPDTPQATTVQPQSATRDPQI